MSFAGLAVSNIAWPPEHDAEALELVAAAGFTGIELAPGKTFGFWETIELEAVRMTTADFAARGLPVIALQAILFGVADAKLFGTPDQQDTLERHLRFIARIAGACGGVPCVFGAPSARDPGDLPAHVALERAAAFLAGVAPAFADEGASLAFEANPTEYGCRFVTRTAEAVDLVRSVGAPGLGLQLDTGAVLINREAPDTLALAAPVAVHCHASVPQLEPVAGQADALAPLADVLRRAGYKGWVSVEMRTAPDWRSALRQAGPAMRAVWQ